MKWIVYLTINKINQKIYIGIHKTENPKKFDGYLGCGVYSNINKYYDSTPFQCAVKKYGPSNFTRIILSIFDNESDALNLEKILVTEEFVKRNDTYNVCTGGGYTPLLTKTIYQYNLNGVFIKKWDSIIDITRHYNINKDRISMCMKDKRSYDNSYWSEEYYDTLPIIDYRPSSRGTVRIYNKNNFAYIKSFKNLTDASKSLDIPKHLIQYAMYDKYSCHGYYFLKEGENIQDYIDGSIKQDKFIYIYNCKGDFIEMFNNIKLVKQKYKYNKNEIIRSCKLNALYKNLYWSYEKYNNIINENPYIYNPVQRTVYQYDMNNNFIKQWNSIEECKKEFPFVLQVLTGKRIHCKKYKFSFNKLKIQSDLVSDN